VDGWETRRRYAPGAAALFGCAAGAPGPDAAEWFELLPLTGLQPDTRHRLRLGQAAARLVSHVRLEIHPDGGMARLRLFGELTAEGRARLGLAWFDRLPTGHATAVLAAECGLTGQAAADLAAQRPFTEPARLHALLSGAELAGLDGAAAARVRAMILGLAGPQATGVPGRGARGLIPGRRSAPRASHRGVPGGRSPGLTLPGRPA
jgi:allantoicase